MSQGSEVKKLLLIHAAIFSLLVLVGYPYYLATLHGLTDRDGNIFGRDFAAFWAIIEFLKQGDISGLYAPDQFAGMLQSLYHSPLEIYFRYPPHFLFLLLPFTYVHSYVVAYALWTALNACAFALALFWRSGLDKSWRWIAFCAPMVLLNMFAGQNGMLIAALLVGGFRLIKPAPIMAGVVLGFLSIKPQWAWLVPFMLLALGQYRVFAACLLTGAFLVVTSSVAFGWQSWLSFIHNTVALQADLLAHPVVKMFSVYSNAVLLGLSPVLSMALQTMVTLIVAVLLLYRLRQMRDRHWADWLLVIAPALYLLTPYGFVYDFCLLSAVWVMWLSGRPQEKLPPAITATWLALWYAPMLNEFWYQYHIPMLPALLILAFALSFKASAISDNKHEHQH